MRGSRNSEQNGTERTIAITTSETTTVTMPQGVYRVGMTSSHRVMMIEREDANGKWRIVWQASMRKDIGKRLMAIVTLAGAHH